MQRIVIEMTRAMVRLAIAEGGGSRCRLRAVRSQPVGATGESSEALKALLGTHKPGGAQVIGIVSREQVITRVVKFPAVDYAELAQMVELYAKGQLPYPREQLVMDFHILGQQEGFSTIAIVACQRDTVERQLAVLRDAGLPASLVTVSSWGVLGWHRQAARPDPSKEPCLVVNVDDTRTDLVLLAGGRILSSRSIGQGTQDWQGMEEIAELLVLEVERSRAAIRKEVPGTEVRSLVLTGVGAFDEWTGPMAERLSLPVSAINARDPFKGWTTPLTQTISPVVIGGVACSDPDGLLNLSPPELRLQVSHRRQVKELVTLCLLLIGVLVVGAKILSLQVSRQRHMAVQLQHTIARSEPEAKRLQSKTRSSQLVTTVLTDRRRLALNLAEVFRTTPASVALEALTFERAKRQLVVRGNTASTQEVLDYIKQLEHVQGISAVDLRYTTQRSTPAGDRTDFELILHQEGPS